MKKVLFGTLILVMIIIAVILILAATKPDTFRVQRSISINAKPRDIAAQINDFKNWTSWSPYEKLDPAMKRTYGGAPKGKGSVYEWKGNFKAGAGRMEITDVSTSRITIKLDFLEPMEGHNTAEFIMEPQDQLTKVTWTMQGPGNFFGKII